MFSFAADVGASGGSASGWAGALVGVTAVGGFLLAVFGLVLRFRQDNRKVRQNAASAASAAADRAVASLQAALDRSDRDVASLRHDLEEHLPALRREVAGLSDKVDKCEDEKRALTRRVIELEKAS